MKIPAKIKVIICDLGNVLAFFDHKITSAKLADRLSLDAFDVHKTIEESGLPSNYETGELSDEEFFNGVMDLLACKGRIRFEEFSEYWGNIFTPNYKMVEFLSAQENSLKIILLSNTNNLHFAYLKSNYPEILEPFEGRYVLSHLTGIAKPNTKIFRIALDLSGEKAGNCLYLDDLPEYVEVAESLGMKGYVYGNHDDFIKFFDETC